MDAEHRRRLEQRRRALQEAARLRERTDSVRAQTEILGRHGVPYTLSYDDRAQVAWLWKHFPRAGGLTSPRIDWPRVAVRVRGPGAEAPPEEAARWLARLAADEALEDAEVYVLSGNARNPAIHLSFRHLAAHPEIVACTLDTWVVSEGGGWVVERLEFEEGWWWGRADPAAGDDAATEDSTP